jgi:hypothetical protein
MASVFASPNSKGPALTASGTPGALNPIPGPNPPQTVPVAGAIAAEKAIPGPAIVMAQGTRAQKAVMRRQNQLGSAVLTQTGACPGIVTQMICPTGLPGKVVPGLLGGGIGVVVPPPF